MSLIGDALKKAHLETVRQDGTGARLVHTPGVAHYRRDPGRGKKGWAVALVASNLVLAAVVAAVFYWGLNRDTATAAAVPATPVTTAAVPEAPAQTEPVPSIQPAASPAPVTAQQSTPEPMVSQASPPTRALPTASPVPAPSATSETETTAIADSEPVASPPTPPSTAYRSPTTTAPKMRNGLVDGQTYMRSVPVPGGKDLLINGMSIAGDRGVALINSKMVREGDRIGPFTVGKIADRRVQLFYEDITIYLRLP